MPSHLHQYHHFVIITIKPSSSYHHHLNYHHHYHHPHRERRPQCTRRWRRGTRRRRRMRRSRGWSTATWRRSSRWRSLSDIWRGIVISYQHQHSYSDAIDDENNNLSWVPAKSPRQNPCVYCCSSIRTPLLCIILPFLQSQTYLFSHCQHCHLPSAAANCPHFIYAKADLLDKSCMSF